MAAAATGPDSAFSPRSCRRALLVVRLSRPVKWVGTGDNRPIAPDQLERGLGQERVREMAGRSGLSLESLLPLLVAALPAIIDALTPRGQVPQPSALDEQLRSLQNRLG
jgi:uncharacterized protein YidB (DUF937 family)